MSLIDNYPWKVAQFMPTQRIELVEGDIVRFGRIPFIASRIRIKGSRKTQNQQDDDDGPGQI